MNKLKLFAATLLLGIGGGNAAAQTDDVTATYIQNPSFELEAEGTNLSAPIKASKVALSMYGWTESGLHTDYNDTEIVNETTENSSQYGKTVKPADGQYYFFVRQGWKSGTNIKITSNETSLPAGIYKLSVKYKQAYGYDDDNQKNSNTKVSLAFTSDGSDKGIITSGSAIGYKGGGAQTYFNTAEWSTLETTFTLTEETTGNVEVRFAVAGARRSDFLVDDVRLDYSLADKTMLNATLTQAKKVAGYDDLNTAIESCEKIYLNAYATQEETDAAVLALSEAFAAVVGTKTDVTAFVENHSFETGTLSPWTANSANDTGVKDNSDNTYNITNADGSYVFNTWGGSSEKYVKQFLTGLPTGYYKITALIASDANNTITLYAGDKNITATMANAKSIGQDATTPAVYVSDGTLEIGAKATAWYKVDNFRLTYYTEAGILQEELAQLIDEAQGVCESGDYNYTENLETTIADVTGKVESVNTDELKEAIAALNTAIKNLKISNASMELPYTMELLNGDMATNSGWTGSDKFNHVTDNENPGSNVTRPYYETWVSAPGTQKTERQFSQTLANCPQGAYELKAAVTATYQMANVNVNENTGVYLYVKDGENITKTYCKSGDNAQYFSVIINHETNGDLEVGLVMEGETRVNWVAFDNFSLTCYGIGNYEALAQRNYENVKAAAVATTNENVIGYEAQELAAAIAVEPTTTEEYIAAANDLQVKTINFNRAEPTYDSYADWKTTAKNTTLAYASTTSKDNLTTAINTPATVNSAADAKTAEDNIVAKLRAYYESNGMAEGIENAVNCTGKVVNADFSTPIEDPKAENRNKISGWTSTQGGGSLNIMSNETWTNADGSLGGNYYDYYNSDNNIQQGYQVVNDLTPGKYIVTVKARAQSGFWLYLIINDNQKVDIKEIGNTGGVFNRGWNDYTAEFTVDKAGSVKIAVANTPTSKQAGWFGFGDVRLVKIGDLDEVILDENETNTIEDGKLAKITLNRTIAEGKWNTLVLPFDLANDEVKAAFGEEAQVAAFSNTDGANVEFNTTEDGVKANVPVLIKAAAGNEFTFDGYTLAAGEPTATGAEYNFVGCYGKTMLTDGDYLLVTDQWWKKEATDSYGVKGFRAFLRANNPETAAKTLSLVIDGETTGVKLNTVTGEIEGETYNISGQKVTDSYKGIVIKNGKKTVRK